MAGLGDGLGYSRLTVPEDGLSQSLQFWGGEAGRRKAAADDRIERAKVREEQAKAEKEKQIRKDNEAVSRDYKPVFNNYKNQNEQAIGIANKYNSYATELKIKHREALEKGDLAEADKINLEIKKIDVNFSRFNEINTNLKDAYDKLSKLKLDGKMSSAYDDEYSALDYGVNGDLSKVEYDITPDSRFIAKVKKIDDKGQEYVEEVDPEIYMSGVLSNVEKFPFDTAVDTITKDLGTYKDTRYKGGYDVSSSGWTQEAKDFIKKKLDSTITDKDVISWAGDNRGAKFSTLSKDPKMLAQYRQELKEELANAAMARENREFSKKRNTTDEELNLEKQRLALEKDKANKPKDDEVDIILNRLAYDAKQAYEKGDYSGLYGVVISETDKKTGEISSKTVKKVATSRGNNVLVTFSDGSTVTVPRTKQGLINFMAQGDGVAKTKAKDYVERAITIEGTPYDRPVAKGNYSAAFDIKPSDKLDDDDKAKAIQDGLPDNFKVEATGNWLTKNFIVDTVTITAPNGKKIDVKYTDPTEVDKASKWIEDNNVDEYGVKIN